MPDLDAEVKEEQARIDEQARRRNERMQSDIRHVVKTPEGRRFYWLVLERCLIFHTTFVDGDAHGTSKNEGRRQIGLGLLEDLMQAKPDAFTQMQRESASEKKQEKDRAAKRLEKAEKET